MLSHLNHVWLFGTPFTIACQALLFKTLTWQKYWIWLPFPPPGDLPNPGIEPATPALAGGFFTTEPPGKPTTPQRKWKCYSLSCVPLFATPRTVAHWAPLSMQFSRQEYWSAFPFPFLGDLPNPGIEPGTPTLQTDSTDWAIRKPHHTLKNRFKIQVILIKMYCLKRVSISAVFTRNKRFCLKMETTVGGGFMFGNACKN